MSFPTFIDGTTTLAGLTVPLNSIKSFSVPLFSDPDGDAVTISLAEGSGGSLPSWIKLKSTNSIVEAAPTSFFDVKTHNVKILLTTVNEEVTFPFTIIVTNTAPVFSTLPQPSTTLYIGETKSSKLPSIYDAEGHATTIKNSIPKSFITFNNVDTYTFSPTAISDLGTNTVTVTLSDSNMETAYSFSVTV